ncbi:GNAT family N-acetyltransferase [Brevundimonas sp.]|uniref:GNAT family N-acetyltransferase n=1 Tax=Brevundimonas sp. TaxID=1871086 RepID=UPI003D0E846B
MSVDPELFATWARGWALTRKAGAPVRDREAWRIEVGQPDQLRRFVYADLCDDVSRRGTEVTEPFVFLKVCAEPESVRPLLPSFWDVRQTGTVMVLDAAMPPVDETDESYRLELWSEGPVRFARLDDKEGREAARGRAVRVDGHVIYDRIAVAETHRRRGLGGRIMRTLQGEHDGWGPGVLVATDDGARLYRTLAWREVSPYTTAVRL